MNFTLENSPIYAFSQLQSYSKEKFRNRALSKHLKVPEQSLNEALRPLNQTITSFTFLDVYALIITGQATFIVQPQTLKMRVIFGEPFRIMKPTGFVFHQGQIYFIDHTAFSLSKFKNGEIFDLSTNDSDFPLALGSSDDLLIMSEGIRNFFLIYKDDKIVNKIEHFGQFTPRFPSSIASKGSTLFITDQFNHGIFRVQLQSLTFKNVHKMQFQEQMLHFPQQLLIFGDEILLQNDEELVVIKAKSSVD